MFVLVSAVASVGSSVALQSFLGLSPVMTGCFDLIVLLVVHHLMNRKAQSPIVFAKPARRVECLLPCKDGKLRWLEIVGYYGDAVCLRRGSKSFIVSLAMVNGLSCRLVQE